MRTSIRKRKPRIVRNISKKTGTALEIALGIDKTAVIKEPSTGRDPGPDRW